jgi:hypothetical protein
LLLLAWLAIGATGACADTNASTPQPRIWLSVPREAKREAIVAAIGGVRHSPGNARVLLQVRQGGTWRRLVGRRLRGRRFRIPFSVPRRSHVARIRAVLVRGGRTLAASRARTLRVRQPKCCRS